MWPAITGLFGKLARPDGRVSRCGGPATRPEKHEVDRVIGGSRGCKRARDVRGARINRGHQ